MDMNASYNKLVTKHLPKAQIVYDRFHMQSQFGRNVLGVVRLDEARRHKAKEKEILKAKAIEQGKPADIAEKMVEGSVQKYLKEVSLLNQTFVKNDKQTVEQMLKEKNTVVAGFTMFVVGEGIEKKVDDFAAEVAAQVAAASQA